MSNAKTTRSNQKEENLRQQSDWSLTLRLWDFMRAHRSLFLLCLLLLPMASGLALLQPYLIQIAIDDHFTPKNPEGFGWILLAFVAVLSGEFGLRYLQFYLMQVAGQRALKDLRCAVFAHLQRLKISFFHTNPVGRLMTRLTTDIDSLQEAISSGVVTIIGDLFTLGTIVTILLYKNWSLALVTFSVVPVLFLVSFGFRYLMRKAYRELRVNIASLNANLQESVTGMKIIQLFAHEAQSRKEYREINDAHLNTAYASIRWDAILYAFVEMISSIAVAGIIWYGAGEAIDGAITLGALVAFIEYAQKFFVPIRDLSQKYALVQSAMASSERLFQLLDQDEILPEDPNALPLPDFAQSIEFRNVWFSYKDLPQEEIEDDDWVLRGINLTVNKGERVAFVGHTGAGKSTIIGLLTRMYDIQKGEILLDGVDIRRYKLRDLRDLFSLVLQDGFLFSGTLRDNITLGIQNITEDTLQDSARAVHLDRFVDKYAEGYDREVKERGSNFSAGERQLVTFARALAHDPSILILDEATANVDTETESLVQGAVDALMGRQTSIVIAHRLSTIEKVDRIFVLHRGTIAETGNHQELLSQGGLYARLVELQYNEMSR